MLKRIIASFLANTSVDFFVPRTYILTPRLTYTNGSTFRGYCKKAQAALFAAQVVKLFFEGRMSLAPSLK
jgi:hypothetical protein